MDIFKKSSKDIAKERLQFILIHDRIQLSPQQLEEMKRDIIAVVSKYVEVEETELEMSLRRKEEDLMALHADIPIRTKRGQS